MSFRSPCTTSRNNYQLINATVFLLLSFHERVEKKLKLLLLQSLVELFQGMQVSPEDQYGKFFYDILCNRKKSGSGVSFIDKPRHESGTIIIKKIHAFFAVSIGSTLQPTTSAHTTIMDILLSSLSDFFLCVGGRGLPFQLVRG